MISTMIIVVGNRIINQSSNPGSCCLHFTSQKHLKERYKFIFSAPRNKYIGVETGHFNQGIANSLREGNCWIQTSFTLLKN